MAHKSDLNMPVIITVGLVSVLLLAAAFLGVHAWYLSQEQDAVAGKWEMAPDVTMRDLKNEQLAKLNTYRWVDRDKQIVAIPIADAMQAMVENGGKVPVAEAR